MYFFFSGRGDSHRKTMNIFFSGSTYDNALPEQALSQSNNGRGPCLMLTHHEIHEGVNSTRQRFKNIEDARRAGEHLEKERVWMHFLDSGAFSLYIKHVASKQFGALADKRDRYAYYYSDAFWQRVDEYAAFVKQHRIACDLYATLDVILNAELTWEVQKYLEHRHKLDPVPVVHFGASQEWARHYLREGYKIIGLGGMGQIGTPAEYRAWLHSMFEVFCPPPSYKPIVRVHGFALTGWRLLVKYPWWSVDSASWCKAGGYGVVSVPHKRGGKFDFSIKPYNIITSREASARTGRRRQMVTRAKHIETLENAEKKIVYEWFDYIEVPLGSVDKWGDAKAWGVTSNFRARIIANLKFFKMLEESLPEWPWKFAQSQPPRASFNL